MLITFYFMAIIIITPSMISIVNLLVLSFFIVVAADVALGMFSV